jgi:hypothetical protein
MAKARSAAVSACNGHGDDLTSISNAPVRRARPIVATTRDPSGVMGSVLLACTLCLLGVIAGYLIRIESVNLMKADRDLKLTVCIDATDRASWKAGLDTAQMLSQTMTKGCMASYGYALVTDTPTCNIEKFKYMTPVNKDCYWRPRTKLFDFWRDDLSGETSGVTS